MLMDKLSIRGLTTLLKAAEDVEDIDIYRNEILELLPFLEIMIDFDQNNTYHNHDLWYHSMHTVVYLPRDINDDVLYLAALLHDIGKPISITIIEEDPNYHFYGHQEISYEIVKGSGIVDLMREESYSDRDIAKLLYYIRYHDYKMSDKRKHLRKHLNFLTMDEFRCLMQLQIADAKAHVINDVVQKRIDTCTRWLGEFGDSMYKEILDENDRIRKLQNQAFDNHLTSKDILNGNL